MANELLMTVGWSLALSLLIILGLIALNTRKKIKGAKPSGKRIPTGIHGLDETIQGGFIPNTLNLVSGGAGTGKTLFGLQFIHFGALLGEPGIFVTFEEKREELIEDAKIFGWDFLALEKKGVLKLMYFSPFELGDFEDKIEKAIKKIGAKRVVIDPFSALGMGTETVDQWEIKKLLSQLESTLKSLNCTSILVSEIGGEAPLDITKLKKFSKYEQEEYICDSVIVLHYGAHELAKRYLRIIKMRRTNHVRLPIPFKITSEKSKKGVLVGE
jgi:circadian clock protein KaiC